MTFLLMLVLILLGAFLIALEIILPGLIWAMAGIALWGYAAYIGWHDLPKAEFIWQFGLASALGALGLFVMIRTLMRSSFMQKMILRSFVGDTALPTCDLVGKTGTALTPLSPRGKVKIGDHIYEAVCRNRFLRKQTKVTVLEQTSFGLIVTT